VEATDEGDHHAHQVEVTMLAFVLYLIAFVCFVLVAFGVGPSRVNLLGIGLGCWVLVPLIHAWPG
jgi:uncharacterized membrane protein